MSNRSLFGKFIPHKHVKKMMEKYRKAHMGSSPEHAKAINWAWLPASSVLDLFKENKVDINDPVAIEKAGIRIYLGTHSGKGEADSTVPKDENGKHMEEFCDHNTIILVLTQNENGEDKDVLDTQKTDTTTFSAMALDTLNTCPPKCSTT